MTFLHQQQIEASKLERLVICDSIKENLAFGGEVYTLNSGIYLKRDSVKLIVPREVDVYDGGYMRTRMMHSVFAVKKDHLVICSILQRENIKDGTILLPEAAWLNPSDSLKMFNRLHRKEPYSKVSDFEFNYGNYPLGDLS